MNIIQACKDERLFRPYFGKEYRSFSTWRWVMRAIYGLPITSETGREFIQEVTGRDPDKLNPDGYSQVLCLTGRRSGKSKSIAAVGAFEAALAGHEDRLSPGEIGMVAVISPTKHQSNIVKTYIQGIFNSSDVLRNELKRETATGLELRSGIHIGILAGDWRTCRGFSLLSAIVDEVNFFGIDSEQAKVKSDTELIAALRPGLATTGGRLIGISSVYGKRGWGYEQWKRHFGNNKSKDTLIVHAPSKVMNPTLDERVIRAALQDDYAKANAEFNSVWRDDVGLFIPREVVEGLVMKGTTELLPRRDEKYHAFVDVSGGRGDDSALAIAHREDGKVVMDFIGRWKAPFNPEQVVNEMVEELRRYRVDRVVGDNYAGEWVSSSFTKRQVKYTKCEVPKSQLYLELLPKLQSGQIELLDHEATITQLCSLERRTKSGGKDIVDHVSNAKDDLANALAGVAQAVITPRIRVGAF